MYCNKCGTQIEDGIAFCPKCGAKQSMRAGQGAGVQSRHAAAVPIQENPRKSKPAKQVSDKKKTSPGIIIGMAAGGLAATAAVAGLIVWLAAGRGESGNVIESVAGTAAGGETPDGTGEVAGGETPDGAGEVSGEETPLYSIPDVAWVDLTAENHTLGAKQPGMTWDSTLFYWLEDVDTGSSEDGYLAQCRVTKTLLRDAQSQKLRQYEIYSDPANGAVYKIVSIEQAEGSLALVDYYYRDGRPDFIFSRGDTVYTPTYATPSKVGERYYFNDEVMVRWRMIREPNVIGEYVLSPMEVSYSQGDYYAENDELRGLYDQVEQQMFNAAYNTYDAVVAGGHVGLVQGALRDTLGNGIADKKVRVYREADDVLLYEAVTDTDGQYSFFVYLDDTVCYLKVEGDELYRETLAAGVQLQPSSVNYSYGLTMHKNSGDEYPVTLRAYSCMDVVSDENGTVCGAPIQAVTATVREGAGNYSGESVCTVETQNGELTVNLAPGAYTVQFHAEGYLDHYMEVEVGEEAAIRDAYVMPGLAENQTGVILTWDSDEVDLDLTLFTPYQAENGDMAHIGGSVDWDGHGNILVSDNGSRCEAMFINSGEQGSYKLFVNNYTDSASGNYASDALYRVNVRVYLYNCDGFVAEYTVPLGQSGVVWEVVEVNGRNVTPAQRVYNEISGKSWWTGSKEAWNPEEDAALLANLQSEDSDLRDLMVALVQNMSEEEIASLLRGEKTGVETFFYNARYGGSPSVLCLQYVYDNQPENIEEYRTESGGLCLLSEDQAEYILFSVCGQQTYFDFSEYVSQNIPYIVLDDGGGATAWHTLENFSIERLDFNKWKVKAFDIYAEGGYPGRVVSHVCFTVVKNPDSCFDGYSLTGFAVEEEAPTDWAQIYYDYLTTVPEGIALADWYGDNYNLLYVDSDIVPEICLGESGGPTALLYISDKKVICDQDSLGGRSGQYVPYTGCIETEYAEFPDYEADYDYVYHYYGYKLEKGKLNAIYEEDVYMYGNMDRYLLNGIEVTPEQCQETIDALVGTGEFQSCTSTHSISVLEMLDSIR